MKTLPCLLALAGLAGEAVAQITVQLPTYANFSVNTSVLVPDRGGMWLGGGGYSSFGGLRSAPPGQMLRTVRQGAAGIGVSAWIHDHPAMDRSTLDRAQLTHPGLTHKAAGAVASALPASGAESIAELRRQREAEKGQLAAEAAAQRQTAQALRSARAARTKGLSAAPAKRPVKPAVGLR